MIMTPLDDFLVIAKKNTYANPDITPILLSNGKKRYTFSDGAFSYTDTYHVNNNSFRGIETVTENSIIRWKMEYTGGVVCEVIPQEQIYAFLKEVLQKVTPDMPFRGPERVKKGLLRYHNIVTHRDAHTFRGEETISTGNILIYALAYYGELLEG